MTTNPSATAGDRTAECACQQIGDGSRGSPGDHELLDASISSSASLEGRPLNPPATPHGNSARAISPVARCAQTHVPETAASPNFTRPHSSTVGWTPYRRRSAATPLPPICSATRSSSIRTRVAPYHRISSYFVGRPGHSGAPGCRWKQVHAQCTLSMSITSR